MSDFQELWNEKPWWPEDTTDKEMAEFYYKKGLEAQKAPLAEVPCSGVLSALLEVVKDIRKSDCGGWLKDCYSGTFNCRGGVEKRQELMRLLDKLYKAASR